MFKGELFVIGYLFSDQICCTVKHLCCPMLCELCNKNRANSVYTSALKRTFATEMLIMTGGCWKEKNRTPSLPKQSRVI